MERNMKIRKWIIYSGVFFLALSTVVTIISTRGSFKAFDGSGGTALNLGGGGTTCGYTETAIKVMNDWQKQGILNICQQEVFINKADDALFTYAQSPANQVNLTALVTVINSVLANPNYQAAAKVKNYAEMRRIERAALLPLYPQLEGIINQIVQAFKDSGGKKISFIDELNNFFMPQKAHAICAQQAEDPDQIETKIDVKFERDCWKPLKWPKGWETGPSPIGIPGWGGVRNPKDLPGWQFGGGPLPGIGDGGLIMPPGSGGWGIGIGTGPGGQPWVGIGGGNQNGGVIIGGGGGGIIIGGGFKF
jgi:hypothetical protein